MNKIAILGPNGTFSHEVLIENFENNMPVFLDTIKDVFEYVKNKKVDFGIVPIENSIGGTVGETLDCITQYNLFIKQEILHLVKHNLCGYKSDLKKIERLFCHPQTYSQCQNFIRKNILQAKVIHTVTNSDSAKLLVENSEESSVAILPKAAAMIYGLPIIKSNIQDNSNNTTRFIVISKEEGQKSNNDRTTISIYPQKDKPGLLHEILGYFANNSINLTKIESRPSKGKLGNYIFFIDIEGNRYEEKIVDAFQKIKKVGNLSCHGSYKKEY